jgi:plastocyanin
LSRSPSRRAPLEPADRVADVPLLRVIAVAAAALLTAARGAGAFAVVEGAVTLPPTSAAPAPKPRYPVAATYTVGPPDPPAAIVYLEGDFPPAADPAPVAQVAQHAYQFAPGVLAVRRGTIVRFPNLDDEYHSVFSYSKPKRFDLGRYAKGEPPAEVTFDEPGVVRLFCEIHDHMRGTIVVLDTPYFAKTDPDGRYRLARLPPGRFVLKAWLEDDTVREQPVELRDGATLRVDFPGP